MRMFRISYTFIVFCPPIVFSQLQSSFTLTFINLLHDRLTLCYTKLSVLFSLAFVHFLPVQDLDNFSDLGFCPHLCDNLLKSFL